MKNQGLALINQTQEALIFEAICALYHSQRT